MLRRLTAVAVALTLISPIASLGALASQTKAASVAGNWEGTMTFTKDGAVDDTDEVFFTLKQEGSVVSGTAGPSAERQFPIAKVKSATTKEGPTVAFEVNAGSLVIWFDLKLVEGKLKGTATGERTGERSGEPKQTANVEAKLIK